MRIQSLIKSTLILIASSSILVAPVSEPIVNHPSTIESVLVSADLSTTHPELTQEPIAKLAVKETPRPVQAVPAAPVASKSNESMMREAGIPESDWAGFNYIFGQESGFCHTKWQGQYGDCPAYHGVPASGGYGICQSTPAHKMASAGEDWATNPITQLRWCYQYTLEYGSVQAAVEFKKCTGKCYSPRTKNYQYKATPWF